MQWPYYDFHCFFIVEHTNDKDFIHHEALHLLMSQCRNYEFYGACCREWELGFDEVDIMLHPGDDDDIALTSAWKDIDAFVDALDFALSLSAAVPFEVYLIYDDEGKYQTVLKKLEKLKCST